MGYVMAMGRCIGCSNVFSFNPVRVPSIRINGTKEPICKEYVEKVNPMRRANGVPEIVPHPDAYDAADEQELG